MANEYLKRTPTSTGNRKVFTWSVWVKRNELGTNQNLLCSTAPGIISKLLFDTNDKLQYQNNSPSFNLITNQSFRDVGSWIHILFVSDTTNSTSSDRIKLYVNGSRITDFGTETYPAINSELIWNQTIGHWISNETSNVNYFDGELFDIFHIDGQALTPEVFGFYKDGNGYISAGSTQATDFRPGQWVPKTPRIIKADINSRGGFGVNGFYLPMNSSNNFGADFHCTPNSILKLKKDLPQPKAEIDGVGDYTGALRDDPFKDYLVLAIPGVSGGLQNGFGDYSAAIRGSGSPLSVSTTNSPSISSDHSVYYGSSVKLVRASSQDVYVTGFNKAIGTGDFTIEGWYKFDSRSEDFNAFNLYEGSTRKFFLQLRIFGGPGDLHTRFSGTGAEYNSGNIGWSDENIGNWYHVAAVRDNGTFSMFLNGVCVGVHTNHTENIGSVDTLRIGYMTGDGTKYLDGYFQDVRFYTTAKYKGGFDVPKPYTPVGIGTWRAVPDTTANNFATWNPLSAFDGAQSNGNLTSTTNDLMGTVGVSTGKWYWEIYDTTAVGGGGNVMHHGVSFGNYNRAIGGGFSNAAEGALSIRMDGVNQSFSGTTITITSNTGTVPTYSNGDIYSIALDLDTGVVRHYRNGSVILTTNFTYNKNTYAIPYTRNNGLSCSANFGQNPTFSGQTTAGTYTDSNGKGLFKYEPPSGFLALCEDNLPTPAIKNPGEHFKTVLYTGDGNTGRSIVGVGFQPDFVWIKTRDSASGNHILVDSIRGSMKTLFSNHTLTEYTDRGVYSFNADGFTTGAANGDYSLSGTNYVAWCWKAGGPAVTNTDGTITSQVSANQTAGFSIATYTATGSTGSIGHGLGKTPAFVITKHRNLDTHWRIWHKGLSGYNYTLFFNTVGEQVQPAYSALPTDSVINLAGDLTGSYNFVTYCWAEIEGFSKFGSYVGNASTDGPFVYCGFKPAWVLIKWATGTDHWFMCDSSRSSTNPVTHRLDASDSIPEIATFTSMDFLSNGFKLRTDNGQINGSGGTYIFAAFAESAFSYSNAK